MNVLCGPAKVTQLDIPVLIKQKIFGFDIAVHDIVLMEIFYRLNSLCEVEKSLRLGELVFGVLVVKEVTPFSILKHHVQVLVVKHCVPERGNVGVGNFSM